MQRMKLLLVVVLLVPAMAAHGEQPATSKDATGQSLHPLTIRGMATNQEGKPVAGAKVFLLSTNRSSPTGARQVIGETAADAEGKYAFLKAPLPLDPYASGNLREEHPSQGAFQVFALAEGYGFTWHPKLKFHLDARPKEDSVKDMIYAGEEARADLAFDLPATLSGVITNQQGQPLAGVRVQVGYCDDPRRPEGYGSWMCSYVGPEGDETRFESGRFDGIRHVPEKYRTAVTDEKGRYQFAQLRRDTVYLMLLDAAPECDPVQFAMVTSKKELGGGRRSLGYAGEVNESFKTPWQFLIKVMSPDGQPLANVKVRTRGSRILRAGGLATTDAVGQATLKLLADKYTLILEPPYGSPLVLTEHEVTVSPESAAEVNSLTLDHAAMLLIKAMEEGTGKPVAGVSFVEETDSGKRRQELQSQTVFVDHPVTDEQGELTAVVRPGERRVLVGKQPIGFEPVNKASELLKLTAKASETVTFTFKKVAAAPASTSFVPEDEGELGKLNALILRQQELTKAGRFELKSHVRPVTGLSGEDLRSILADCNAAEVPNLPELLRKRNAALDTHFGHLVVVVDRAKTRNEIGALLPQDDLSSRNIMAFNGLETVDYSPVNAQASVYSREGGGTQIGLTDSNELTSWRPVYKMKAPPGESPPERKVTREAGRITVEVSLKKNTYRQVFDEKTGFPYHQAFLQDGGALGRERWQFAPRAAPSGGIAPGLVVEANYRDGQVGLLRIYELVSFTLGPQPWDAFIVSVPPGTNIVDFRGTQRSPKAGVVGEPVTDVVARANQISDNSRSILNVVKDGDPAPAIEPATWLNADGNTEKPDWKGKVLLVDFWGTTCGPCVAELPAVQKFAVEFQKAGGVILGLHDSGGDPAEVREFVRKRGLTYQFAIDKSDPNGASFGATFTAYGIRGIPNCAVIDQKGNVVYLGHFEEASMRATRLLAAEGK